MKVLTPSSFDDEDLLQIYEEWCIKDASEWTGRIQERDFYNKYGKAFDGRRENVKKEILKRWARYKEMGDFWMNAYNAK